jgi:hypothetical protein
MVFAVASAQWGWRLPCRRLIRLLLNWRWWVAMVAASLAAVALPGHIFAALPAGTVPHQVWMVMFKLAGAYVLAMGCWVLLLGWCAALLDGIETALVGRDLPRGEAGGGTGGQA